ncbi:hypothetical protein [Chloroflexus sp.]|uniref:hypothetical protein n=1 Tax=Chloroflexus sp. TaxID=1904827 RepID=UPI003D0FF3FA
MTVASMLRVLFLSSSQTTRYRTLTAGPLFATAAMEIGAHQPAIADRAFVGYASPQFRAA